MLDQSISISWQIQVSEFMTEFENTRIANPDWSLEQIAKFLNKSTRTVYRMLSVSRHLDDPRITASKTLNQAYGRVKTYYQTPTDTIFEITSTINSIVGEDK